MHEEVSHYKTYRIFCPDIIRGVWNVTTGYGIGVSLDELCSYLSERYDKGLADDMNVLLILSELLFDHVNVGWDIKLLTRRLDKCLNNKSAKVII
jgi:hypothetical protein